MAQLIILQENYKTLDEKMKHKILENYNKTLDQRKQKRMQRIKGIVRQLYTEGHYDEADKYFDNLPSLLTHHHTDDDDDEASDSTAAS
jgi:hypothetical protein